MNDIRKILDLVLKESGVNESELVDISLTRFEAADKWECAVQTRSMRDNDPGFIRVDVDKHGARVVPMH
jgi:hypothetical protein